MIIKSHYKRINYSFLIFILFSFSICGSISNHYLGASLDISKGKAVFIDKIECTATPHWNFKLSTNLEITSIEINDKIREFVKINSGPLKTEYKIHRNFWEAKDALITIQYQTKSNSLFKEIIPNRLVQLKASEIFYPQGNEFTSTFEFHLQIPQNWKIVSDGNVSKLKDKKSSYKISSANNIAELNLFFLKNFIETPQLNNKLLTIQSLDLNKEEKQTIIQNFFIALDEIENFLGPYPYPKFDIVFAEHQFESNSLIFIDDYNKINNIDKTSRVIFNQYFKHFLYPKSNQNQNWMRAIECYLFDYLPLIQKNLISAKKYRKEILNFNSKSLIPEKLKKYSLDKTNQFQIQTYLYLLFTLENQFGVDFIIEKIKNFIKNFAKKPINDLDLFSYLTEDFNFDLDFFINERFENEIDYPFFEIIESDKSVSIIQPEKVFPMLIPIKYHFNDSSVKDSTIFTKSFKTLVYDKSNSNINKIEIDPNYHCQRKLFSTELDSKINDLFQYNDIQIFISPYIKNHNLIKTKINEQFPNTNIIYREYENLNNEIPSIIIGELPNEYKYLSTKSDLILNGRKFYLKNHCIAYTFNNQKNNTNLIIYSKSEDQIFPVIDKLKFFKNYSYYVLRNGNNADKGTHKTHLKHLVWKN